MQMSSSRPNNRSLSRAIRYLGRYPRVALAAIGALLIAAAAQLSVPQLIQRIIDNIISSATQASILNLPAEFREMAATQLGLDLSGIQAEVDRAPGIIITAGLIVIALAAARGIFAFAENYLAQTLSQNIAY